MSKNSTKTIFSFLLFSAIFAFVAACGDGSSTEASNDDSAMESTWVSLDNIDSSDAVMATKTLDNGIKLHFDKKELKGKEISVNYRKAMPESLQENAFGLTIYAGVEFAPGGLTFDVPIEVTLPLNKKPDTDSLLVLYYNEKERVWEATDMAAVQGKNVVFHVNHFSLYAVVDKNINDMLDYFDKLINDATDNLEKCPGEEKLTKEVKKFVDYIDGKDGYNLAEARGIITYPKTSCGKVEGYFASAQIYNDSEKKESFCFGGYSKKEDTDHLTLIHKTESQMGKKEKSSSEYQKIFDRGFSIFYGPAESTLEATASTTSLGEGETATINISNMCGEDPMEGYVIKVKTSGNMEKVDKGDIVIGSDGKATLKVKMTDASENGWVELTTTSLADEKLVTKQKIEFEADTSTAETWEMSLDVTEEQQGCIMYSTCTVKTSYHVEGTFTLVPFDALNELEKMKGSFPLMLNEGDLEEGKWTDLMKNIPPDLFAATEEKALQLEGASEQMINFFSNKDEMMDEVYDIVLDALDPDKPISEEEMSEKINQVFKERFDIDLKKLPSQITYESFRLAMESVLQEGKITATYKSNFASGPRMTTKSTSFSNGNETLLDMSEAIESIKTGTPGKLRAAYVMAREKIKLLYLDFEGYKLTLNIKTTSSTGSYNRYGYLQIAPTVQFSLTEGTKSFNLERGEKRTPYKYDGSFMIALSDYHITSSDDEDQDILAGYFIDLSQMTENDTEASGTLTLKRIK